MKSQPVQDGDDLVAFIDEGETAGDAAASHHPKWKVLIADDEREVHAATLFALKDIEVSGRRIDFLHAYSAAEAHRILAGTPGIAVVLLDVVMETGDAGLRLARTIRNDLGLRDIRIILRTGQPGYAPEMEVIRDYDINDYRTKTELTRTRLLTSLTTAIRSYELIRAIMEGRRGHDLIIRYAPELYAQRDAGDFAACALRQAGELIREIPHGVFCARRADPVGEAGESVSHIVIGASGRHAAELGREVGSVHDPRLAELLQRCCREQCSIYEDDAFVLHLGVGATCQGALLLETAQAMSESVRSLLDVFCVNVSVALENVNLFQKLNFFAYFDTLSRLPNRAQLIAQIDDRLRQAQGGWTVAIVDVDHFSDINASFGHQTGDRLLSSIANLLRASFAGDVVVARVSGGAFGLLGPDAALSPERILDQFARPIVVDGQSLMIQPLLGLERLAEAEGCGSEVLKNAQNALNGAKSERRNRWRYYTREMQYATQQRLALLHDLRHAAEAKRGLALHYQPLIECSTGKIVGAEALMRWRNDSGEEVPPARFIPLAEYSHLIVELGEWALCSACEQLKAWEKAGHRNLRMSVNVSVNQFRDPHFIATARNCIREAGIDPGQLELEVTETQALSEIEAVLEALYQARDFGMGIAIDDFGTGFSSLSHLHRLPINRLKIDRSFVSDLSAGSPGATIADMIIKLGRMLGLAVIAEGVETRAQLDALLDMGCEEVQGFYFSPPVSAEDFAAFLKNRT